MRVFLTATIGSLAAVALYFCVSCGGDTIANVDMSVVQDSGVVSKCGQPGDAGNSLHVGAYCTQQVDCVANTICSHAFRADTYFCTLACTGPGVSTCGDGASCQYQSGLGYGCVPTTCAIPDGG